MKQAMASFLLGFFVSFGSLNVYNASSTLPDIRDVIQNDGGKRAATEKGSEKSRSSRKNCETSEAGGGLGDCGVTLNAPQQLCPSQTAMAMLVIDTKEFKKQNTNCTSVKWETSGQVKVSATADKNGTSTLTQSLRNQNGAIKSEIEVLVIPQELGGNGTLTAKLVNQSGEPCNCGDNSSTKPVKTQSMDIRDVELTKFNFEFDNPVCEKCGVGRNDFIIRTNPAGRSDEVQLRIPNQDPGTHTASAILCGTKEAKYTIIDQESGWHTVFDGTKNSAGDTVNATSWKRWKIINTGLDPDVQVISYYRGKVRYFGNWTWKKLGGGIKPPGGKFTTSRSISKTKLFSKRGTATFTFKGSGASVSTSIGVQLETSTTNTNTSGGRECKCGKGCEFRYRNYQSTISLIRFVKKWRINKTTTSFSSSPKKPPNKAFGPGNLIKDDHKGLPEIGQQKYTNSAEKRCN